jgi:hypothetical protein
MLLACLLLGAWPCTGADTRPHGEITLSQGWSISPERGSERFFLVDRQWFRTGTRVTPVEWFAQVDGIVYGTGEGKRFILDLRKESSEPEVFLKWDDWRERLRQLGVSDLALRDVASVAATRPVVPYQTPGPREWMGLPLHLLKWVALAVMAVNLLLAAAPLGPLRHVVSGGLGMLAAFVLWPFGDDISPLFLVAVAVPGAFVLSAVAVRRLLGGLRAGSSATEPADQEQKPSG